MWAGCFPNKSGNGVPQALHHSGPSSWLNFYLVCCLGKEEEVRLAWPLPFIGVLGHQLTLDTLLQPLLKAKLIFCFSSIVQRWTVLTFLFFLLSIQLRAVLPTAQLVLSDSITLFQLYIVVRKCLTYYGARHV